MEKGETGMVTIFLFFCSPKWLTTPLNPAMRVTAKNAPICKHILFMLKCIRGAAFRADSTGKARMGCAAFCGILCLLAGPAD